MTRAAVADQLWSLARPLLFRLPPERAHDLALRLIDWRWMQRLAPLLGCRQIDEPVELMGLRFANRVGLAAGLDKNGRHVDGLASLGFGFLEVGTVTPLPQPGNERPRLFRLTEHEALINRFGFNNEGIDAFIDNVRRARYRDVLGLNIGRNAVTSNDRAVDDYLVGLKRCHPHASYIVINVSSPNTKNLRELQHVRALSDMLAELHASRRQLDAAAGRRVPLLLKIAPDLDDAGIDGIAEQLIAHDLDGVIATNTTLARDAVSGSEYAAQAGGLSGAPLTAKATAVVARLRRVLPHGYPIIGSGGIQSAADATARFDAGADLIQLYTGLIYHGPWLVTRCAQAMRERSADRL